MEPAVNFEAVHLPAKQEPNMTVAQGYFVAAIVALANGAAYAGEAYIAQPSWSGPQKAFVHAGLEKMLASPIKLSDVKLATEIKPGMNVNVSSISQSGSANLAVVSQNGGGNLSLVAQQGSLNRAIVTQGGTR